MRLKILLALGILAAALPAFARDPMIKDCKFTVCAFQNFDKCELLTERTNARYHFNTREKRMLQALQRHAAAKSTTLAALEQSFG